MSSLDVLYAEDTRVTKRLLDHYDIQVPIFKSYREDVHAKELANIISYLNDGKNVGYVSDAGTPGIHDPGARLVAGVLQALPEVQIIPIPGASALITALSVSGLPSDQFIFLGFPPHKKGRKTFFEADLTTNKTTVLYESPHRIIDALDHIESSYPNRQLIVMRELTKMFESTYRGTATQIKPMLEGKVKGEFVIILEAV